MGVQYIYLITISLVLLCAFVSSQRLCAKVDFNNFHVPEFRQCQFQRYPPLIAKDYATHAEITKYRQSSQYYLSNNFLEYSCIETDKPLRIDKNSFFEIAIFVRAIGNSFVSVTLIDGDNLNRIKEFRIDNTQGWIIRREYIPNDLRNGRVEIKSFMNQQSVLGIEYIHILNSVNRSPECISINLPPPTRPPPPPTTVPPATSTTTEQPSFINNTSNWEWIVAGISVAIILIIAILVCVNCIFSR